MSRFVRFVIKQTRQYNFVVRSSVVFINCHCSVKKCFVSIFLETIELASSEDVRQQWSFKDGYFSLSRTLIGKKLRTTQKSKFY